MTKIGSVVLTWGYFGFDRRGPDRPPKEVWDRLIKLDPGEGGYARELEEFALTPVQLGALDMARQGREQPPPEGTDWKTSAPRWFLVTVASLALAGWMFEMNRRVTRMDDYMDKAMAPGRLVAVEVSYTALAHRIDSIEKLTELLSAQQQAFLLREAKKDARDEEILRRLGRIEVAVRQQ